MGSNLDLSLNKCEPALKRMSFKLIGSRAWPALTMGWKKAHQFSCFLMRKVRLIERMNSDWEDLC